MTITKAFILSNLNAARSVVKDLTLAIERSPVHVGPVHKLRVELNRQKRVVDNLQKEYDLLRSHSSIIHPILVS